MHWFRNYERSNLRGDLLGGLTSAVVALPLALAFGNAALGPGGAIYGLYGAIVTGFIAAILGGTPAQVTGPTGPMSVTVSGIVASLALAGVKPELSAGEILPFVMASVIAGGLIETAMGLMKLGRYITLVPYSVISGFMSGIGMIILILQIGPMIGIETRGGIIKAIEKILELQEVNWASISIAIMTIGVAYLTPAAIRRWVPTPLLALVLITPLSIAFFNDQALTMQGLEPLERIGTIPEGGLQLSIPNIGSNYGLIIKSGVILAVLGAIDSLLTSLVADNITRTNHDSDQELIGQGVANVLAGFTNSLPGAGATMRTVINIKSGGKTPISGAFHSVILLVVLIGAGPLASQIPTALLAGILTKVGIDIIDWGFLTRAHKISAKTAGLMYTVLLLTVFWDLIWGVVIGMFVANLMTVDAITRAQNKKIEKLEPLDPEEEKGNSLNEESQNILSSCKNSIIIFKLSGPLSFGAAGAINKRINMVIDCNALILDLHDVAHLGVTSALAIERINREALSKGRTIIVSGADKKISDRLTIMGPIIQSKEINEAIKIAHALIAPERKET